MLTEKLQTKRLFISKNLEYFDITNCHHITHQKQDKRNKRHLYIDESAVK